MVSGGRVLLYTGMRKPDENSETNSQMTMVENRKVQTNTDTDSNAILTDLRKLRCVRSNTSNCNLDTAWIISAQAGLAWSMS